MASLKYYYDIMSQPCRAVWIFMKVNSIPFTPVIIDIMQGQHMTEEYAEINPYKRVPAINDNGFVLTESVAILQYLCATRNVPSHWYPQEPSKKAKVDEYTNWQHTNTRPHAAQLFFSQAITAKMTGKPVDPKKLKRMEQTLEKTLDLFENMFLKNQKFLCGDSITIADLLGLCELMQVEVVGREIGKERPKIGAWMARVKAYLGQYFDEAHKVLYKVRDNFLKEAKL